MRVEISLDDKQGVEVKLLLFLQTRHLLYLLIGNVFYRVGEALGAVL